MKKTQEKETLGSSFARHITGIVLAGLIILGLFSFNQSYELIDKNGFHLDHYGQLAKTITAVLQKKQPPQALLPQHFLHPELINQVPLSNGKLSLTKAPSTAPKVVKQLKDYQPLVMNGKKQLKLQDLDALKRAQGAHIQLRFSDQPARSGQKREEKINVNPIGWHNYDFPYQTTKKKGEAWLMNRGHLVGYQFSGLNDELRNLVPETRWLNAGDFEVMNAENQESQLYVEEKLASWLHDHQGDWLDLEVQPLYKGNNLIPDRIQMTFVGLDESGKLLPIVIPSNFGQCLKNGVEQVTLKNYSPNAIINYATGVAIEK